MALDRSTLSRYMRNHLGEIIAESKAEERVETLTMLIRRRFGDVPDAEQIATRLAPLGRDTAMNTVFDAKTLDELRG